MQTAIEKYKSQYQQTEDDVAKDIPMLFREYFAAYDEDREPILVSWLYLLCIYTRKPVLVRLETH